MTKLSTLVLLIALCDILASVLGELDVDTVYEMLARRIDNVMVETRTLKVKMDDIDARIKNIEGNMQELKSTIMISVEDTKTQQRDKIEDETKYYVNRFNTQALAVRKMLTNEKKLLREHLETLDDKIDEFKSELRLEMAAFSVKVKQNLTEISTSLDERAEEMFVIVTNNSKEIEQSITMLRSDINATSSHLMHILVAKEKSLKSEIEQVNTQLITLVESNNDGHIKKFYSVELKMASMSSNMSSWSSALSSRIASEASSLSSRISSVSSSLDSQKSSLSSRISSLSSDLSSKLSSMSSDISSLSSRISKEEERKIAFSARLTNADSYYNKEERIDFNEVSYNHGGGYDSSSGIFTTPKSGTYLFIFNIASTGTGKAHVRLMVDGRFKTEAIASGTDDTGGSCAVTYVSFGQKVWIETVHLQTKYYIWSHRTQFTGVLLD